MKDRPTVSQHSQTDAENWVRGQAAGPTMFTQCVAELSLVCHFLLGQVAEVVGKQFRRPVRRWIFPARVAFGDQAVQVGGPCCRIPELGEVNPRAAASVRPKTRRSREPRRKNLPSTRTRSDDWVQCRAIVGAKVEQCIFRL